MANTSVSGNIKLTDIYIGIAWCLAWGDKREPQFDLGVLQEMRRALNVGEEVPPQVKEMVDSVRELEKLPFPNSLEELKEIAKQNSQLMQYEIGLVYGGATKIKQYVFEAAKLPDIRGASALLDRINLVDLPAFFSCENDQNSPQCQKAKDYCQQVRSQWLDLPENFPELSQALIPELIIYSTGGNILAFSPAAFAGDLANAIEKRYTHQTLTANSCAVGAKFKALEIQFGLLPAEIDDNTFWMEKYRENLENPLIKAYFEQLETSPEEAFEERKTFNELAGKLASLFNQRRNGNNLPECDRPSRSYPPMFETHPYLRRDESDRRSAVFQAKSNPNNQNKGLPGDPWFSEALARKRLIGQIAKKELRSPPQLPVWWQDSKLDWDFATPENMEPGAVESWVNKFEGFLLRATHKTYNEYYGEIRSSDVEEARSVREIANASLVKGFVAYIYADGNNMGGYIQKEIKNPETYQRFSRDIFEATEKSVYVALAQHLKPHKYKPDADSGRKSKEEVWIHPFEILTIGGDDVMLIVPADRALAIAKTIGEEFERLLVERGKRYQENNKKYCPQIIHRYLGEYRETQPPTSDIQCKLSMSAGVLITAEDTPIYYAEKLTNQLLKSAKKRAKELKQQNYYGGTVDFLVMKSVTMISSNVGEFRSQGLTKSGPGKQKLKLYAAPYTLYELGGLLETAKVLKKADFPRSQLYQIRSLLERGKHTVMLNYRYFRVRLQQGQDELRNQFENAWCQPLTNDGNLAPWMTNKIALYRNLKLLIFFETFPQERFKLQYAVLKILQTNHYETIWRELVDLYPFIEQKNQSNTPMSNNQQYSHD
ncbi:MAG: type III-B CRISPR-associated protein Cas10/Cmr2 [Oscillatoriaceae cyanobacterium Prado104]|jgi:CRISPR-associated protein Cmr2|nr:type III-B CRISPR-associated protein Cas10/Cmr2 [Oscillatoriaceae cyanobacterium Prado104]